MHYALRNSDCRVPPPPPPTRPKAGVSNLRRTVRTDHVGEARCEESAPATDIEDGGARPEDRKEHLEAIGVHMGRRNGRSEPRVRGVQSDRKGKRGGVV